MVTELMFEKQRKVKQLNTEKAEEEKKKKKKRKRKQSTSSSSSDSSDGLEIVGENDKSRELAMIREAERQEEEARNVQPLPLPADMSKAERELTLKAIQELTREASAFVKGRNAKKMMGYEMGANLNNGKTFYLEQVLKFFRRLFQAGPTICWLESTAYFSSSTTGS